GCGTHEPGDPGLPYGLPGHKPGSDHPRCTSRRGSARRSEARHRNVAADEGSIETAKELVKRGADLNAKNDEGQTPEQVAREEGNRAVADWLAEAAK
ncbi:MAG: ankyrin repeat domain-containing protein, partial [Thermoguttaceae bacterium]|nr:ankyrin repeat domain-containing protein [Thermoguttaceae bacterium]